MSYNFFIVTKKVNFFQNATDIGGVQQSYISLAVIFEPPNNSKKIFFFQLAYIMCTTENWQIFLIC